MKCVSLYEDVNSENGLTNLSILLLVNIIMLSGLATKKALIKKTRTDGAIVSRLLEVFCEKNWVRKKMCFYSFKGMVVPRCEIREVIAPLVDGAGATF